MLLHNRVIVTVGVGSGAGLSVSGGHLRLDGCLTQGNVAESLRSGNAAAAGEMLLPLADQGKYAAACWAFQLNANY